MSKRLRPSSTLTDCPNDLSAIAEWWLSQPDARERFRWVLRDSLDQVFDGERTGRWCYMHLGKIEKTYLGSLIEINLSKEFAIQDGRIIDWLVADQELDCKFSKDVGGWEIPMEMYRCDDHMGRSGTADHAALLVWLDDDSSQWAAGLFRVDDVRLKWKVDSETQDKVRQYNRDNKRNIAPDHLGSIYWLWGPIQSDLPENILYRMPTELRARIFDASLSGQKRVNMLFRLVPGKLISRYVVCTVAQQEDAPKRARDSRLPALKGGLASEGYLILGHQESHPQIARLFDLPVPEKGEWVSVRVTPVERSSTRPRFRIGSQYWAAAIGADPVQPAPKLPRGSLAEVDLIRSDDSN